MNSIYQLLQGITDSTAHGISDQHMSDDLEELQARDELRLTEESEEMEEANRGMVMGQRPEEDVWGSIFHATEITQKSWSRELDEREYNFIPAMQRDYTELGYCLEFEKAQMEPFQVGELIGVRAADGGPLRLCMVRWLNEEENNISAGVMRLAESMEPALVVLHQDGRRIALYCLLGIGEEGPGGGLTTV
jgi:hypothetical protein